MIGKNHTKSIIVSVNVVSSMQENTIILVTVGDKKAR